jgi:Ca-activated chloride channel homolog
MIKFSVYLLLSISILFGQNDHNKMVDLLKSGNKLVEGQQYDQAMNDYQQAIKESPNNPNLWYNIGNVNFHKKQYADARSAYYKALEYTDSLDLAKTNYNIGNTYMYESKLDTAISYYKKALELNPSDEDAKYNLELARAILKEKSKKEKQEQKQDEKEQKKQEPSDFAKKLLEKAKKLVEEFKFIEAYELLQRGIKTDPTVASFSDFIKKLENVTKVLK